MCLRQVKHSSPRCRWSSVVDISLLLSVPSCSCTWIAGSFTQNAQNKCDGEIVRTHDVHERMHNWDPAWREAGPLDTSSTRRSPTVGRHPLKPCQNRCRSSGALERGFCCGSMLRGSSLGGCTHITASTLCSKAGFKSGKPRGQIVGLARSGLDRGSFENWGGGKLGYCLKKWKEKVKGLGWEAVRTAEKESFILTPRSKHFRLQWSKGSILLSLWDDADEGGRALEIKDRTFFQYVIAAAGHMQSSYYF